MLFFTRLGGFAMGSKWLETSSTIDPAGPGRDISVKQERQSAITGENHWGPS